ncbi:S-type Pyocin [Pseudomonas reinekei]|jgi:hypothetical protein|uniref:Colicin transporter n=1 Tax=Pseudomonas reinekei TaxID=395598 RepID=A0A1H0M011_PSERE|nr:S-type pyocin domain-containing protein [Pseudomonas reinekei]KAB0484703.1 colicin transporter [Pseudomonas reinekei]OLU01512.1 colicin transporter [Pseudomonas reinekei]SDO73713.1 S-type Pyocin [Pseudomonas reinekei]
MPEKQGPPLSLPPTNIRGEDGTVHLGTTYVGAQPKPGKNPQSGGFRIPPTRAGGMGSGITNTEGLRRETGDKIRATEQSVKAAYEANFGNLSASTEADLANVRAQYPTATSTTAQAYQHELNVRNVLIQQKNAERHTQTVLANYFYGHSPLNTSFSDYLARAKTLNKAVIPYGPDYSKWVASYKAAYSAKLLTEQIQLLNNQHGQVQNLLATAQAQEQRAAAEQARLEVEREAQRVAAEEARLEAEAEVLRQAEQLRLENERLAEEQALSEAIESSNSVRGNHPFAISGAAAASGPIFTLATGRIATNVATTQAIRASLQTGVTAVMTAAATSASAILVGFAALLFPSPLGDGESRQLNIPLRDLVPDDLHTWSLSLEEYEPNNPHALSVPLSDLTLGEFHDLRAIAEVNGEIELPVAIGFKSVGTTTEFFVAATNGISVSGKVPVRLATYDSNLNLYTAYNPEAPPIGMTWTPIVRPTNASTYSPASAPSTAVYDGTTLTALEGRIDSFPELDLYSFGGFITVFPAESGIPPTFTMFRDRRGEPGAASGYGEPISGVWLGTASQDDGAVIPNQIADKLRGQDFPNFRAFREALWKAVASDPELAKQFRAHNIKAMMNGKAPSAREDDHLGDKIKFELHHIELISEGGAVYDIDNIKVVTPKRHSELHKKVKTNEPH